MNTILLTILALGSEGTATRPIVVEPSIERIVWQCVVGGMSDVFNSETARLRSSGVLRMGQMPSLRIDGRERTGIIAWVAATHRVAGYALDRADAGTTGARNGSVGYAYRLRVRGFNVGRSTRIADGRVSLVTDVYGSIGPNGELDRIRLAMDGIENEDGTTTITATMTGYSTLGKRCWLLRWASDRRESLGKRTPLQNYISREIGKAMSEALSRIQTGGIDLYRAGAIAEVLR